MAWIRDHRDTYHPAEHAVCWEQPQFNWGGGPIGGVTVYENYCLKCGPLDGIVPRGKWDNPTPEETAPKKADKCARYNGRDREGFNRFAYDTDFFDYPTIHPPCEQCAGSECPWYLALMGQGFPTPPD